MSIKVCVTTEMGMTMNANYSHLLRRNQQNLYFPVGENTPKDGEKVVLSENGFDNDEVTLTQINERNFIFRTY